MPIQGFLKPLNVLLFFLPTVFHCSGVFGSDFFCGPVVLILVIGGCSTSVLLLFFLLWSVSSWGSLAWFRVRFRKVVSLFVVCFFSVDLHFVGVYKVILEVVAGARRPSSVSTFSDIFVAVLSRWSGKTAVSILSYASLWLLILESRRAS